MNIVWKTNDDCLQIFKAIAKTNTIINVVFTSSGMQLMGMDSSKTSLVQLVLPAEYFEIYQCTTPLEIGIYTSSMVAILSKVKNNKLTWKSSGSESLTICLENGDTTTEFRLRSVDVEEDVLDIPNITDDVELRMNPTTLVSILDKIIMAKSGLKIKVDSNNIYMSAQSVEFGTIWHKEPLNGGDIDCTLREEVSLMFGYNAIVLLLTFAKVSKLQCFLGLSNEMPLRLKMTIGSGGSLSLYIAPRISEE
jgi:proliferating cell nuclear antigen PCNA